MEIKNQFARKLMDIQAIKLQPNEPFTWASGWKSPIYTDNRKTLSFPQLRSFVKAHLLQTSWDCLIAMCVRSPKTMVWEIK